MENLWHDPASTTSLGLSLASPCFRIDVRREWPGKWALEPIGTILSKIVHVNLLPIRTSSPNSRFFSYRQKSSRILKRNTQFYHPASEGIGVYSKELGSPMGAAYSSMASLQSLADVLRNDLINCKQLLARLMHYA